MVNDLHQPCIDALKKAILACEACADACRSDGYSPMMQRCVALDTDCAEFCRMAVRFLQRESEFTDLICEDCAEICRECADECVKHPAEHCQACAKACYACMEECLRMVSH